MSIDYTNDATGKFISLNINGKKQSVFHLNKAQATKYWVLYPEGELYEVQNIFGSTAMLTGFEKSIFEWCEVWYRHYSQGIISPPVQTYDSVKMLLLKSNPHAYMKLID